MKSFYIHALCFLLFVSLLQACDAAAPAGISEPEPKSSNPEPTKMPSPVPPQNSPATQTPVNSIPSASSQNSPIKQTPTSNLPFISNDHAETARQDLAHRLGIAPDDIKIVAIIGQEFSNEAFYCQTSKERIAKEESPQVISGQSILLSASGRKYEYHASDQTVIFCRPLS